MWLKKKKKRRGQKTTPVPATVSSPSGIWRFDKKNLKKNFPCDSPCLAYITFLTQSYILIFLPAITYWSRWESCVVKHGWCGASRVGMGVSVSASRLSQAVGALGGGGTTMDGPGWGWRAGGSWDPDILVPGPVVRRGLPVGLLGELVHLGQRNKSK